MLFVGNKALNPSNLSVVANIAPSQRFIGYNPNKTILYAIGVISDTIKVFELDPNSFNLLKETVLYISLGKATPVFFYDKTNNDFYISEFNYPVLKCYDLDSLITSSKFSDYHSTKLEVFPNPSSSIMTIKLFVPQKEYVNLKMTDVNGKEIYTILNQSVNSDNYIFFINVQDLNNGIYFLKLEMGDILLYRKFQIFK